MAEKVIFDFELNTSGSQRSIKEINDRIKQLTNQLKSADIGSKIFNDLNRELAATRVQADNLKRDFKDMKLTAEIDTLDSENSLAGLQNRLKLLKNEIRGVEIGSEEFKKLEAEIANTNIEMKGLREGLKGLDFGAQLSHLGSVLSGVAGAAGLINDTLMDGNEENEKYIANAARTIMVMQSLTGVMKGIDSATKLFNITLQKNPIMIWVAAAAALVGGLTLLYKWFKSNNEEMDEMNRLTESQRNLLKTLNTEYLRFKLNLAETNGDLKEQLRIKEELINLDFDKKINEISKEFDLEADAVRNASSNYVEYEKNIKEITKANNELNVIRERFKNSTAQERTELNKKRRETKSYILELENQNKAYIDIFGSVSNFIIINKQLAQEEEIFNQRKIKTYDELFKKIKNDGSEAYNSLSELMNKQKEDFLKFEKDVLSRQSSLQERDLDRRIEDAKRLGDVEKLIQLEKEKLDFNINKKIKERIELQENLIESQNILNKKINDVQKENDKAQENHIKAIKEIQELKKQTEKDDKLNDDDKLKIINQLNEMEKESIKLQKETNLLTEENTKLISRNAYSTTSLIKSLINVVNSEINELQEKQKTSIESFTKEVTTDLLNFNKQLIDGMMSNQLTKYQEFLQDTEELLILSEQNKSDKALSISDLKLRLETRALSNKLSDDLKQYEGYFRELGLINKENFDLYLDNLVLDTQKTSDIIEQIQQSTRNKFIETKEKQNNLTGEELEQNKLMLDLYDQQNQSVTFILNGLNNLKQVNNDLNIINKDTTNLSEEDVKLINDKIFNLKIYKEELKTINDAQKAAQNAEIEINLNILMLNREKYNALQQLEALKLERYRGNLKKETEALKSQIELRRELELDMSLELYERKIINHEQYLEAIENIEEVYRRRNREVEIENLSQKLQIAENLYGGLFQFIENRQQEVLNRQLENINVENERKSENLRQEAENGIITQQQLQIETERIQADGEEKSRQLQKDQAIRDRRRAIFEAVLGTITGVAKSIPNPFQMALAASVGGAQVAAASSTPIPQFEFGGVIGGRSHTQGGTVLEAEKDEIILNKGVRMNPQLNNIASYLNESVGGKSFRLPMSSTTYQSNDSDMIKNIVTATVNGIKSIPVINVATETDEVNNKVKRLKNKAKL